MGNFFGTIFKFAGGLVMVLSLIAGLMIVIAVRAKGGHVGEQGWIIALITGVPFLFGRLFWGIGKKLQQAEREGFTNLPSPRGEPELVVTRRPSKSPLVRPLEAVDVDIAPEARPWASAARESAQAKETAPAPRHRQEPDPFAMGVDRLYNPDEGKGS
jgi:hypothetical protein